MSENNTGQTNSFEYDAKVGQIYKIWIVNVLLSIITLGIYRFWGKTRIRRYLTSSFSLHKNRFEYTGYGGELFWGFVKALFLILIVSIPFFWSAYQLENYSNDILLEQQTEQSSVAPVLPDTPPNIETINQDLNPISDMPSEIKTFIIIYFAYLLFFLGYLPFVAKFQALRYRAARLQWSGIRAHLNGSAFIYGLLGLCHMGLMVITLSLWKPFADLFLLKYKMKRIQFGDQTGQLIGLPYFKIFFVYLGTGFLYLLGMLALAGVMGLMFSDVLSKISTMSPEQIEQMMSQDITMVIGLWASTLIFILYAVFIYCIYKSALNRAFYNHLKIGDIGFQTSMTGKQLFGYYFINLLILVLTLGLGYPFVMQRQQRFFQKHIKVVGDLENTNISQASGKKYKTGEGLFAFFDMRISLF